MRLNNLYIGYRQAFVTREISSKTNRFKPFRNGPIRFGTFRQTAPEYTDTLSHFRTRLRRWPC